MKKTFLLLMILVSNLVMVSAQGTFPVTLKVIDQSKGAVTNKVTDHNETNIYCWLDDSIVKTNPNTADWWYPMYNDQEVAFETQGELVKTAEAWEWTLTIQVKPGEYAWDPKAKTLGWESISPGMYEYVGDDEDNNLIFTVSETGEPGGHYELVIPYVEYNTGVMYLTTTAPAGTDSVFVRGLYDDWGTPLEMTYNNQEGAWAIEVDGSKILVGQTQQYKYYYGSDSWDKIEADADGNKPGDGENRTFNFVENSIITDDILMWYNPSTSVNTVNNDFTISMVNKTLTVTGTFSTVKLYTINGVLIDWVESGRTYEKEGLTNGIYLIVVDSYVQKVIIK